MTRAKSRSGLGWKRGLLAGVLAAGTALGGLAATGSATETATARSTQAQESEDWPVTVTRVTRDSAFVSWSRIDGATGYDILIDGAVVAEDLRGTSGRALHLRPGTEYELTVYARLRDGQLSQLGRAIRFHTISAGKAASQADRPAEQQNNWGQQPVPARSALPDTEQPQRIRGGHRGCLDQGGCEGHQLPASRRSKSAVALRRPEERILQDQIRAVREVPPSSWSAKNRRAKEVREFHGAAVEAAPTGRCLLHTIPEPFAGPG